jgi:hypothetical protein
MTPDPTLRCEYDLLLLSPTAAKSAGFDAELRSQSLDSHLSTDASVPIVLELAYTARDLRRKNGTLTLESVQARSIEAFLREQSLVRQAVENVMTQARQSWLRHDHADVAAMWADTTFFALYLPCRELIILEGGRPDTASAYSVIFNVAWDPEHGTRAVKFRDGAQVGFGLPGD